jgi:2-polyprenyl-3-methyl-5-hydroxy-6-metoxy-1,4-benzoquinol methylase
MKPLTSSSAEARSEFLSEVTADPAIEQYKGGAENPFTGASWAAQSEAYAQLIAEHLHSEARWLDAGCGWRLLEDDMEPIEDWLVKQAGTVIGMDVVVTHHRNIRHLVEGTLNALPFADRSLDLVTCNMVVEHLDDPVKAFTEVARCLRPGGAIVINTPNLWNYGILANAVATKVLPESWRLRIVHNSDSRPPEDIFPVRYKANTLGGLCRLLEGCGLQIHKARALRQQRPFLRKAAELERFFMKLTPNSRLLVCACKRG